MALAIIFIMLMMLVLIGIWMKSQIKWDGRYTIKDLIKERGGDVISIEKASLIDHMTYSGKLGNGHATYYHVKYADEEGIERECVVRQPFLLSPSVFKEYIPKQSKK